MDDEYIKEILERALWYIANHLDNIEEIKALANHMLEGNYPALDEIKKEYVKNLNV